MKNKKSDLTAVVESWSWNGSWFPEEECFEAQAIQKRAKKFNSTLE